MTELQKTLLNNIEMYYKRMLRCSSTAGRKNNYEILMSYYEQDVEFCSIYWEDCRQSNHGAMPYLERIKKRTVPRCAENFTEKPQAKLSYGKHKGLYFVGQCFFNPYTREEHYCLKIGLSTDLNARMKQYATHTPMCWQIDFLELDNTPLANAETIYHNALKKISKKEFGTEWLEVDRLTYLNACEKGFNLFDISLD